MKTENKFEIGQDVIRIKGDYVVGRTGLIVNIVGERAQVQWKGETTTWVTFSSIALTSIPYKIIPAKFEGRKTTWQKYRAL